MAVRRNYRINLRNYGNPPAIMVSQYDENYDLVFEVYDGVVPATGLNTYTVKLVGRQPGNDPALKYEFTGTVSGLANNILSFTIDTTMTGRAGKGTAEIVILDTTNDVKFASFNLPVYVEKAAVPDDAIDADVERAQGIAEQVQGLIDGATYGAEAWATGQKNGVDVETTDPTYHNNSKYYAEQAQEIADSIGIDATLSITGKAADAKKTGDEISSLKEDLNAVSEVLFESAEIDFATATVKNGYINSNLVWNVNNNAGSYFIPVPLSAKTLTVQANPDYVAQISFLTNDTVTHETAPSFCDGTTQIGVSTGTTQTFEIPATCAYICIRKKPISDYDQTPTSAVINNAKEIIELDATLSMQGKASDAKATGDAIKSVADYVSDVPSTYKRLEYLESTDNGNQYVSMIDALNNDTRIKCKFAMSNVEHSGVNYIFGGRFNSSSNAKTIGISQSNRLAVGYATTSKSFEAFVNDTDPHIVDYDKNKVYLDNLLVAEFDPVTFETPVRAVMFATAGATTSTLYYGSVKIYRCTVWDNGVMTHDFVPVYDIDNDRYGMFDLITQTFSRNPSTPLLSGGKITTYGNRDTIIDLSISVNKNANNIAVLENTIEGRNYIKTEADRVSGKVRNVQTGNSLTFIACSDLHYAVAVGNSDGVVVDDVQAAIKDMRDGILAIANQTHIDFYACFGDVIYQWQNHGADYDNGVKEMVSVTKLLSEAFGNNPQVRIVGNHDPNCENGDNKEFGANLLNAFEGIYNTMLAKNENQPYGGYGYHDFERQKVRLIVLNTSFYTPETNLTNGQTVYNVGAEQAYWLCTALDLSEKADASDWQIMICSHVALDITAYPNICRHTAILDAYLNGSSWSFSGKSYDFANKNLASLSLYINGHTHAYRFKNMRYVNTSGTVLSILSLADLYVPNALPGREEVSTDGETYIKTAGTAESTSFQVITVDFENKVVYAIHYGAGIDIVMHYIPSTNGNLNTALTEPVWESVNTDVATVLDGMVTPVAEGYAMIYAKSETDNTIEVWNYQSVL